MLTLTEKRFSDFLRTEPETGMGYWMVTVFLRDGRMFPQTVVVSGVIARIRNYPAIPFLEAEIEHLEVTHEKWDWSQDKSQFTRPAM